MFMILASLAAARRFIKSRVYRKPAAGKRKKVGVERHNHFGGEKIVNRIDILAKC